MNKEKVKNVMKMMISMPMKALDSVADHFEDKARGVSEAKDKKINNMIEERRFNQPGPTRADEGLPMKKIKQKKALMKAMKPK